MEPPYMIDRLHTLDELLEEQEPESSSPSQPDGDEGVVVAVRDVLGLVPA